MLVSYRHRLVILSMPKCASESLAAALGPQMDIIMANTPVLKHTPYRRFDRFIRPFLETRANARFETACLFREPLDWLHSWWRYRGRDGIPDPARSTRGVAFSQFLVDYLNGRNPPADIGQQSRFVSSGEGVVGVDRIFRFDHLNRFAAYLEARLEMPVVLDQVNASPPAQMPDRVPPKLLARIEQALAVDYEIYNTVAE